MDIEKQENGYAITENDNGSGVRLIKVYRQFAETLSQPQPSLDEIIVCQLCEEITKLRASREGYVQDTERLDFLQLHFDSALTRENIDKLIESVNTTEG